MSIYIFILDEYMYLYMYIYTYALASIFIRISHSMRVCICMLLFNTMRFTITLSSFFFFFFFFHFSSFFLSFFFISFAWNEIAQRVTMRSDSCSPIVAPSEIEACVIVISWKLEITENAVIKENSIIIIIRFFRECSYH